MCCSGTAVAQPVLQLYCPYCSSKPVLQRHCPVAMAQPMLQQRSCCKGIACIVVAKQHTAHVAAAQLLLQFHSPCCSCKVREVRVKGQNDFSIPDGLFMDLSTCWRAALMHCIGFFGVVRWLKNILISQSSGHCASRSHRAPAQRSNSQGQWRRRLNA